MSTGTLATLSQEGDTKITWDSAVPAEVEAARATFDALREKGYLAYRTQKDADKSGVQIRTFDPTAEKIVMVPALQGG
jgi:hypothetical protein